MTDWWEQPYEGGKLVDVPGLPRALSAPEPGKAMSAAEVRAYKRIVARLGRWKWDPAGWDDSYSKAFALGAAGGAVGESGVAGVQRQGKLPATGAIDEQTFNLLRAVRIPKGLPHAGEPAIDAEAVRLLTAAYKEARKPPLETVQITATPGDSHWGGSNDVMTQFVEPFMRDHGLPTGSGKRTPAENTACGGSPTSDHLTTKTTTAARDFPTTAGENAARALAEALGCRTWKPNSFDKITFSAGGRSWSTQILWGAAIDHDDHVHIGISPA